MIRKCFTLSILILTFHFALCAGRAQDTDVIFTLDASSSTVALPKLFKPSVDLSGRGFHYDYTWPQELAARQVLDTWQEEIGFGGVYRLQYNLWEINQLTKNKDSQQKLLANYEAVIKSINDAGGIVILNIFGTPPGLGKVLDKKSLPWNLKAFKESVKSHIRELSCNKKYNIWYEVWSAPDLDDFFLGRKQDYFNVYKAIAESVKELEKETKIHIPIGGPSTSWWFQNFDGNTIVNPETSLIYEFIRFCRHYRLPIDFITWHAYSTDPRVEKETTLYSKTPVTLIRTWLSYFNFDKNIPLIVDEWNYDSGVNILSERQEASFVCASYIPARLKNMYEAGITYQTFFSLEDFQDNKEGVKRNVGVFWYEQNNAFYKGGSKSIYSLFKMLNSFGNAMFVVPQKPNDEFLGLIATKGHNEATLLIYNYIDPDIFKNYISRNIATLNKAERKDVLRLLTPATIKKILGKELDVSAMKVDNKVKTILKRAQELNDRATKFMFSPRTAQLSIKNLNLIGAITKKEPSIAVPNPPQENYTYKKYVIDSSCGINCAFAPVEQKEIAGVELYQETLTLNPYSVVMIVLKKKPREAEAAQTQPVALPQAQPPAVQPQAEPKQPQPVVAPLEQKQPAGAATTVPQEQKGSEAPVTLTPQEQGAKESPAENAVADQQNNVQKIAGPDSGKKKEEPKEKAQ